MKIPKLNRHDPVEIIWQDAMSNGSGWQELDWEEYENWNMTTRSVGIFIGRTKGDAIVLCRNWHNPYGDESQVSAVFKIPVSQIRKIRRLKS